MAIFQHLYAKISRKWLLLAINGKSHIGRRMSIGYIDELGILKFNVHISC